MSKLKVRCAKCGTFFKTNNSRQIYCDNCERKLRQEKAIAQAKPAPKPQAAADGAKPAWLTAPATPANPVVASQPSIQDHRPSHPPAAPTRDARDQNTQKRDAQKPEGEGQNRGQRHDAKPKKPAKPVKEHTPRPKREPKPLAEPFVATPEQIVLIEQRYIELAQPAEFDGIRTQIAKELGIPKSVVKKAITALRARVSLPSWWDLRGFDGTSEEQEQIKRAYEKHLPVPPLGVHKLIAQETQIPPMKVYLGIRAVRQALGLPPYNPPEAHPEMATAGSARTAVVEG